MTRLAVDLIPAIVMLCGLFLSVTLVGREATLLALLPFAVVVGVYVWRKEP